MSLSLIVMVLFGEYVQQQMRNTYNGGDARFRRNRVRICLETSLIYSYLTNNLTVKFFPLPGTTTERVTP